MDKQPESSDGIYKILMMVYVPEATNGMGMLTIQLPTRKQYESVRKQIWKKKEVVRFINEFGEPHTFYNRPPVLSLTVEKHEVKKVIDQKTGTEKPLIFMPGQINASNIRQ